MLTPVAGTVMFGIAVVVLFATAAVCLFRTESVRRVIARINPGDQQPTSLLRLRVPTTAGIRAYGVGMAVVGVFALVGTIFWATKL